MDLSLIRDLNYLALNPRYRAYEWRVLGSPLRRFLRSNISVVYQAIRHTWLSFRGGSARRPQPNGVMFYVNTLNQFRAGALIAPHVSGAYFAGHDAPIAARFPIARLYWLSVCILPLGWLALLLNLGRAPVRRGLLYYFDGFVMAVPAYWLARRWLRTLRPRAVILANDHTVLNRAILRAARKYDMTTVYIQHAPVAEYFPPLEFDFALLDGEEALEKYRAAGPIRSSVVLTGAVRLDRPPPQPRVRDLDRPTFGIATNRLDQIARLKPLVTALQKQWPDACIRLRPHPSDSRYYSWMTDASRLGVETSESRRDSPADFLADLDVLIAGDTGIHLDAALSCVPSVMYPFKDPLRDYYGFGRTGLCPVVSGPDGVAEAVSQALRGQFQSSGAARYYSESFGSGYEGKLATVVADIIECALRGTVPLTACASIRSDAGIFRLVRGGVGETATS